MKPKKLDRHQLAALGTWHGGTDLRNPTMQLVLETSELAKLVFKAAYKPGHQLDLAELTDEAGDGYYYAMILAAGRGAPMAEVMADHPGGLAGFENNVAKIVMTYDRFYCLNQMARSAANLWARIENAIAVDGYASWENDPLPELRRWLTFFHAFLRLTELNLADVIDWNQTKLAGGNNHGWRRDVTPV